MMRFVNRVAFRISAGYIQSHGGQLYVMGTYLYVTSYFYSLPTKRQKSGHLQGSGIDPELLAHKSNGFTMYITVPGFSRINN
jgi:hypothetical protein